MSAPDRVMLFFFEFVLSVIDDQQSPNDRCLRAESSKKQPDKGRKTPRSSGYTYVELQPRPRQQKKQTVCAIMEMPRFLILLSLLLPQPIHSSSRHHPFAGACQSRAAYQTCTSTLVEAPF